MKKRNEKRMRFPVGKQIRRVTAWLLVFAMVYTLLPFSAEKAEAQSEETEVVLQQEQGVQSTEVPADKSSVDVNMGVPAAYSSTAKVKAAGLSRMEITFRVTYTPADSGTPGAQPYFGYGETWGHTEGTWVNLSDKEMKVTLELSPFLTGGDETIWGYGLQFANVKGTVSYEIISAKLTGTKSSSGGTGGGSGNQGTTGGDSYQSHANFAKLLQYSLYFYDANMCGGEVEEKSLVAEGKEYGTYNGYRKNCHTCDEQADYNGRKIDVSGGYHDAGDHAKFNLPQAYSATMLGLSYAEFADAYAETGQTSHFKTIMEHFCDYFVRCTVMNEAGTQVEAYCYQVGDGGKDHSYWGAPESQESRSSEAFFTSASTPCTDIVGETAAALAIQAYNFPDDARSAEYLACAKSLFEYGASGSQSDSGSSKAAGFYNGSSWKDDMALAAIWLYKATGEDKYKTKYNEYAGGINSGYLNCWDNMSVAALSYGTDWANAKSSVDSYKNRTVCDGYVFVDAWGSARYNTALQFTALCYDKHSETSLYTDWAKKQMNYLLGENSTGHCYVVGYNSSSSKNPHHRAASGFSSYDAFNQGGECQNVLLGALCGGMSNSSSHGAGEFSPVEYQSDSSYFYHDSMKCYVCNEVALDYNASLVAAAAGLYVQCKADGSQMLDTNYVIDDSAVCPANEGGKEDGEAADRPTAKPTLKPGETSRPDESSKPGETQKPAQTTEPGATLKPGETSAPGSTQTPGEPGGTTKPGETQQPGGAENPGGTVKPGETDAPVNTQTPGGLGGTTKPGETQQPGGSANPGGTTSIGDGGNSSSDNTSGDVSGETTDVRKVKLSKKKVTIKRGKKAKVVMSGVAKKTKVKLKYSKKKLAVKLKKQTASQKQYQITGKKKGKYTVTFSIGKKKWKLKVVVK